MYYDSYWIVAVRYTQFLFDHNNKLKDEFDEDFLIGDDLILIQDLTNISIKYPQHPENCKFSSDFLELKALSTKYYGGICFYSDGRDPLKLVDELEYLNFCEIYGIDGHEEYQTSSGIPIHVFIIDCSSM